MFYIFILSFTPLHLCFLHRSHSHVHIPLIPTYSDMWKRHTRWVFAFNNLTLPSRAPDTHKEDYIIQSPYTYSRMDIQAHNTSFMPLVSTHHRKAEWILLSFEGIAHFICFQFPKFNRIIKRSANEKLIQTLRMKVPDQKDWSYSMWCCPYDHSKSRVQTFDYMIQVRVFQQATTSSICRNHFQKQREYCSNDKLTFHILYYAIESTLPLRVLPMSW